MVGEMDGPVQRVVIVGGGTAGWLAACYLAARQPELSITLVEAPDIPTIGVGEGTWPTMRGTLAAIGIPEGKFLRECDASFKQGSRFDGWRTGEPGDSYLHPFTAPPPGEMRELLGPWDPQHGHFAEAMTAQADVCARALAPRQRAMPDYAGALNYAYHLDAAKFAGMLAHHGTSRLGVTHIEARVGSVQASEGGDIAALELQGGDSVSGDLFLDCSGHSALLIGQHCGARWIDRSDVSPNDRALAVQVPVAPDSPIASQTIGTAHRAGWLWDIALPARRGIGCVYASGHMTDGEAGEVLDTYIRGAVSGSDAHALNPRLLKFAAGHRERFWHGNCIALGLSAGFIEPLEASAIVLTELSLRALADNFPASRTAMEIHARRFNELFRYRWDRVVDFLKLHYALSQRTEPYWRAQRDPATIPSQLAEQLELWRDQPPSVWDFPQLDEIFSATSQQYVLYGMGWPKQRSCHSTPAAQARLVEVRDRARSLTATLPTNRAYLAAMAMQAA